MADDLPQRLRAHASEYGVNVMLDRDWTAQALLREAADRLEQLEARTSQTYEQPEPADEHCACRACVDGVGDHVAEARPDRDALIKDIRTELTVWVEFGGKAQACAERIVDLLLREAG